MTKPTVQSSFVLIPQQDAWDRSGSVRFPDLETAVGRMCMSMQFQLKDKRIVATLVLHRTWPASAAAAAAATHESQPPANGRDSSGGTSTPPSTPPGRLPVRCILGLSAAVSNDRSVRHPVPAVSVTLDKDHELATYFMVFQFNSIPPTTVVSEARLTLEPQQGSSANSGPNLYLATLDQPHFCDCALLTKSVGEHGGGGRESKPPQLYVSKAIMASKSPFFKAMFAGNWAESGTASPASNDKPAVPMEEWPMAAVLPCVIHMYCGWLPGSSLPQVASLSQVRAQHKWAVGNLSRHDWLVVMELAEMLQLPAMCWAVKRLVGKLLEKECDEHLAELILVEQPVVAADGGARA